MQKLTEQLSRAVMATVCAGAILLSGCTKDLKDDIKDLQGRVTDLEEATALLRQALDQGGMIKSVTALPDNAGWKIEFTGATRNTIDILNGTDGAAGTAGKNGITPMIDVRDNGDGTITIWYNLTGDPDTGWVNSGENLKGEQGEQGPTGAPGGAPVVPKFKIDTNASDVLTIWYNVNEAGGYPDADWEDLGVDLTTPAGPVVLVSDNGNGTVTITLDDDSEFTFAKFSTAQSFVIMNVTFSYPNANDTNAEVLFRVNPSTAEVPTATANWELDLIATRSGYVTETDAFNLQGIVAKGMGEYVATINFENYDPAVDEYVMALVLNNGTDVETGDPIQISSMPFGLGKPAAPQLSTTTNDPAMGEAVATYNGTLSVRRAITVTAAPEPGYFFVEWQLTLDGEPVELSDLTFTEGNANSPVIKFDMPEGDLVVEATFSDVSTAYAITKGSETNGTFTVDRVNANGGELVTLTATPDADSYLQSYTVTNDADATTVVWAFDNTSGNVTNEATFLMPANDVTVTANFTGLISTSFDYATINGVDWAICNVETPNTFAASTTDFGAFYQFGIGDVAWSTVSEGAGSLNPPVSLYPVDMPWGAVVETGDWDMTTGNPCPDGWVVPTGDQAWTLLDRTLVSAMPETFNSVEGFRFVDRATGQNIFLPGASNRINTGGVANSTNGHYWTSTSGVDGPGVGYNKYIYFYDGSVKVSSGTASSAKSVRCVKAE